MDPTTLTLAELGQGYRQVGDLLICNYCQAAFTQQPALTSHLEMKHGGALTALLAADSKYNMLTPTQQTLLQAFSQGLKDKDIATQQQVSDSTIRHQKFTFREKAKQAQLYLAQYQAVFGTKTGTDLLPMPPGTDTKDARFKLTPQEYIKLTQQYLDFSTPQLILKRLPKGQKKIIALLYRIRAEFDFDTKYPQAQLDAKLKAIATDYVTLRRYLIDYGFLARTTDNHTYWRIF
ncbi:DUF2087 domain-containing protein [Agrilactobacillus composti]|nr:DUF2087 domain-containing protein [Agrilactobacillus composti]